MSEMQAPAGWYFDQSGDTSKQWYWDGVVWTGDVRDTLTENMQPVEYASVSGEVPLPEQGMREVHIGEKLVIAVIAVGLIISVWSIAFNSIVTYAAGEVNEATFVIVRGMFRLILSCVIFVFIYKGHNWARIVTIVLYGISVAFGLLSAISFALFYLPGTLILLVMCMAHGFIVAALVSKPVRSYQNYVRPKKSE